ncbi:MAG: hypothetical protein COX77_03300 [Candidatus Komeilibacteria bacterium CG_4_10_14_0_2_um_filter_37_10]|uniref:Uncharacterized protein n=1 Tax=Candidatus Komeilibacteria bacterium CG_4_10_14_0_2_um_filter_37_10 TaxID=1974470 RepID=A0A2M7VEC8_9BACT|nr:MAG: hypothetical protein COX77_03300 [Candidatus Komeilibacteria bacterium CG_4_10_14_0_2_um_filter_37_10]
MIDLVKIAEILKDNDDKFILEINGQLVVMMDYQAYCQTKSQPTVREKYEHIEPKNNKMVINNSAVVKPVNTERNNVHPLSIRDIIANKSGFNVEYDRPVPTSEVDQKENDYFFQEVED